MEKYYILKRRTIVLFSLECIGAGILFFHHHLMYESLKTPSQGISIVLFAGSVLFSLCLPILFRVLAWNKKQKGGELSKKEFFLMKELSLYATTVGCFFALGAYFFLIAKGLLYVSVFSALYGVYSVFPSKKLIKNEMKTYKVGSYE